MLCYLTFYLGDSQDKTQDTDKCRNRQLYTDLSAAWINDVEIYLRFERTGHNGQ